jgi:peptidoglycan/xylan/chitin deacetylase (PgdA/CDA1 family)
MAARADPELVQRIVERGHERACHGDRHVLVFGQSCCEFEAEVASSYRCKFARGSGSRG